ncbi:hypothetical protein HJG53_00760 [Sphingomonas sp. ID1715]|uniref:hypothetical protein n=1 Tax=Sphingomonas sp. ID1715 TaxID=1656898 RepID=UPI001489E960|nr:hypothetical protein [Sphingomonas sp. ID1715]NNM75440.1 hypothetical protein [Sphingomonas sp. ID1715]
MGKLLILATLAASAAATPALADSGSPSVSAVQLGKCIVRTDRGVAVGLLKSLPLTGGQVDWSAVSLGVAGKCQDAANATVTVSALRGGLAQELFKRDFVEFGVQPQRAVYDLANFSLPVEKDLMGAEDPTKTLFLTADCVARSNPNGTEKLIKSEPGSEQEAKVFDSLGQWLSACQGASRMAYGKAELRSAIVQAAYHVSARYWAGQMTYAGPAFRPGGVQ